MRKKREFWTGAVFLAMLFFIIYLLKENDSIKNNFNKRILSKKRDTINFNDTSYVFRIKIDTAYYDPRENEPTSDKY